MMEVRCGECQEEMKHINTMITAPTTTLYYAGDSGYFVGYREIGRVKISDFDVREFFFCRGCDRSIFLVYTEKKGGE